MLNKGQWDIKWFNNLYTETKDLFGPNGDKQDIPRNTFFTSTVDIFTGVSNTSTFNVGLLLEFRSNVIGGRDALDIPLVGNETENGVFLDQKGFIFQNRFFYDYSFAGGDWQLFSELNTEYNFGKKEDSFANNSLRLTPGVFLSYFPSSKFTILGLVQHSQLIDAGNDFSQDFTAIGGGVKYQLSNILNIETLYTSFVRGNDTGLGQTFNIGLRALF